MGKLGLHLNYLVGAQKVAVQDVHHPLKVVGVIDVLVTIDVKVTNPVVPFRPAGLVLWQAGFFQAWQALGFVHLEGINHLLGNRHNLTLGQVHEDKGPTHLSVVVAR